VRRSSYGDGIVEERGGHVVAVADDRRQLVPVLVVRVSDGEEKAGGATVNLSSLFRVRALQCDNELCQFFSNRNLIGFLFAAATTTCGPEQGIELDIDWIHPWNGLVSIGSGFSGNLWIGLDWVG